MLSEGATAPAFSLPGTMGDERREFRLTDRLADGPVVLAFYPHDFGPRCTDELCALNDMDWFTFPVSVDVVGLSTDGTYSHIEFTEQYGFEFPLLADSGAVAEAYGVRYDDGAYEGLARRALFLIDPDRTIRFAWASDDPTTDPPLMALKAALDDVAPPVATA